MSADYFVYALITLNAGASVCYLIEGHGWKALYWLAVAVLNVCLLKLK